MNEVIVPHITTIVFSGVGKFNVIGLRIFAVSGLISFIALNIALWWNVRVQ